MKKTQIALLLPLASAVFLATFAFTNIASAQTTNTWTGGNTTNNYNTAGNWSPSGAPNAIDSRAIFTSASSASWTNATNTLGSILASGGNLVIGNNGITSDVLNLDTSSGKPVISNTSLIFMYADLAGTNGFTKLGSGELSFRFNGNPMLFTGDINLNAGSLTLNQDSSLGNTNNDIIVGGTSTLNSSPGGNTGTVTLGAGRSITITNGATLTVQNGNANVGTTIDGVVSGAGNLTFGGTGTLTLNGANAYSGTTIVSGGRVNIGASGAIGTNSLTVGNTATFNLGGSAQTVRGLAMTTDAGTARTFTMTNGSLVIGDGNTLTFQGTNGTTANFAGLTSFVANSPARNLTVQPNTPTAGANTNYMFLANTGTASNSLTYARISVGGAAGTSQGGANGAIMQLGKVNAINTGFLTLGGFNGFGTIELPAGASNATLSLRGVDGTTRMGSLIVGETSSGTRSGAGTLNMSNGTINGSISNTYLGVFGANSTGPATTSLLAMGGGNFDTVNMIMAAITNTSITNASASVGAVFQQNGGNVKVQTLTMGQSGAATNVSGPVFLPTYNLASSNAVLRAQTITAGASTNYGSGTVRKINFGAGTIQNYDAATDLTISGKDTTSSGRIEIAVATNPSTRTFLADAGRTITVEETAVITSTGNIEKAGAGSLILNGANTYSGGTAVNEGTLRVNNTTGSATGSGALTVASGATLSGSGIIGGPATVSGFLNPGNSPGDITFNNSLLLNSTATLTIEITGITVGQFDRVVGAGINTFTFGGILALDNTGYSATLGDTIAIFDNWSELDGLFASITGTDLGGGLSWDTANLGIDGTIQVVPEPSTYALIALAASGLGAHILRRRRRR
jgi:fibronectin-binding autotransporter adhesin